MSITPGEVFSGIKFIQGVVSKASTVKDNRTNLQRLSGRLERIIVTIEQTKSRDAISSDDYNDAMTVLSEATQKELKRSLGDRTWNRDEIEVEIKRIIEDVNHHLSTHSVSLKLALVQDPSHGCHAKYKREEFYHVNQNGLVGYRRDHGNALDERLNTPPGPDWSPPIWERAQSTWRHLTNKADDNCLASGRGFYTHLRSAFNA
ncbi:hypothetical protein JAAARDRAFT_196119 [Jaapia argillacea MUCL 33604]|uniref:Uncharacterized protein n=1 Tax=Jaapia argillacea MUCL 33604 TaxID=933084 RepID=A0A067PY59_9AGAM|nr:hypothetical protein JAAARDRAFT_196119 [Jaapia argillacea MUCL 33604]